MSAHSIAIAAKEHLAKIPKIFQLLESVAIFRGKICYLFLKYVCSMKIRHFLPLIISLLIASSLMAGIPERSSRLVNDYAGVFGASQRDSMERRLVALDDSTGNQIVVVTLTDLEGYDISEYAVELGRQWGVGSKKNNNGVVIVVKIKTATSKGRAFIATGYGLEGALPDATCKRIVDNEMIPHFMTNDYYRGVDAALDVIIPIVKGEYSSKDYEEDDKVALGTFALFLIVAIVIVIMWSKRGGGGTTYSSGGTYRSGPVYWGGSYGGSSSRGGGFGGGSFGGGGAGGSW